MDIRTELQYFKPINLDEIIKRGEKIPDGIRNSIVLYNKAIESLRSGSEDIAMIELRKAISLNPHFNEAINLLGVCYSYVGDNEKAAESFNKVIKAESNSVIAMKFMQKLGLADAIETPIKEKTPSRMKIPPIFPAGNSEQNAETLKRPRAKKHSGADNAGTKRLLYNTVKIGSGFVAGLLLMTLIYSTLFKPEPVEPVIDQDAINAAVDEARTEFEKKYQELQGKYDLLKEDRDAAARQADYYRSAIKLYEVEFMIRDRKYEEAADMLLLLKTVEYRDTELEKFNNLYETVMPLAAKSAYDRAYRSYNSKKYQDALQNFEKVQLYDPEYKNMDAVLYYMGRSYQFLQESRKAVSAYQKLIDNYPKSAYVKSAKTRINELTKIP
ncbi:MAG: tetratricopeptide repeat protein [Bacillota bacterium]